MHTINQSSEVNKRFKNKWIVSLEFLVQMGDSKSGTQEVQGLVWDILSSQKARRLKEKWGHVKRAQEPLCTGSHYLICEFKHQKA